MQKVEEFYTSAEENSCKIAVEAIGLQPNQGHKVWVMNEDVHFDQEGTLLKNSPFYWIEGHSAISRAIACNAKATSTPLCTLALAELIQSMEDVYGQNFGASLLMLGAQV